MPYSTVNSPAATTSSGLTTRSLTCPPWGWIDRASRVMKGAHDPLAPFPNVKRWFTAIDGRPAVSRARAVGKDHEFKKVNDEETKRALFPSNYPATDD
jgi:GST-like protein